MAIVCLTSASGSPGVTTTAVGMALSWPRPVLLVEADPTGGSGVLAGFLRGTTPYDAGLIELALSPLGTADALRDVVRPLSPNVSFVAGIRSHAQATALRDVWDPLAAALHDLDDNGQDVIVDAGRLGLVASPTPLLEAADATLLVTRANLPSISAARSWAETIRQPATGWRDPGLLLVAEGQPYRATEVTKVLGMPVIADVPGDPGRRGRLSPRRGTPEALRDRLLRPRAPSRRPVGPGARRPRSVRAGRGGTSMTEAYRFANEYGDLTRLPLFSQSSNGVPHVVPSGLDATVASAPVPTSDGDWALVSTLRAQASEQLSQAVQSGRARLDKEAQQELGRSIVLDLIESAMAEAVDTGLGSWSPSKQQATAQAVFDSLFRLGRLQPLVDDDRIENIVIVGHDNVQLELIDGTLVPGPPVADSDQELIDFLVFLASRSEVNARSFSEAQPSLHMRLDGGSRLAAVAWVTTRPSVVIRRHRLMRVTLEDLVKRDMMTPVVASFLRAAVRARCSIVVAGAQGAGKTTLVRALRAEIDELEAIGTFETEYELHLHELGRHKVVIPWEARPGSGERGPDGRQSGEFTLDEALVDSFRFNLSRQIVGEVRGKEIWAMIKAMESGTGSISTTHAADAVAAVRKLVTCAMEAGPHVTQGLATSKLAATVDLNVQLSLETKVGPGGAQRTRRVAEVIALAPGEKDPGYATTHVFRADATGVPVPDVLPDEYRRLAQHGFDLAAYLASQPLGARI